MVLGGEEVGAGWERRSMWQWLGFLRRTKEEDEREEREYFLPVSRDPLAMILLLVQRKTEVKANERGEEPQDINAMVLKYTKIISCIIFTTFIYIYIYIYIYIIKFNHKIKEVYTKY